MPTALNGKRNEEGVSPLPTQLVGLGERCSEIVNLTLYQKTDGPVKYRDGNHN